MATAPTNPQFASLIALSTGKRVVADGPLSALYCKTLNELFAKELDPATGRALESQANDEIEQSTWMMVAANLGVTPPPGEEIGMLYGVKQGEVHLSDVVQVSDVLSAMNPEEKARSAIVVDAAQHMGNDGVTPSVTTGELSVFEPALEAIARYHGVAVYTSLEAFLRASEASAR